VTFFAPNGKRPVRLCEKTRLFAYESLGHKYGLDTRRTPAVSMDDREDFSDLSPIGKYDAAVEKIAREAPIRICEGERISGAATLGLAIDHHIPAKYKDEAISYSVDFPHWATGISHLTVDFETPLKKGVNYIEKTAREALLRHRGTAREEFIKSCLHCIGCFRIWHERYLSELSARPEYRENCEALRVVPFEPARSFYEAVQSLWFTFAFLRLCGNWPGIGRIDLLLGDYLEKDLADGTVTLGEAREILAHFFIKGCEWICGGDYGSGDAQHYQNIVLAGTDENGKDVTNAVTYLVLDIIEELGIGDFPTTVRINKNTDERLLSRVSEVIRLGGGVIAVYNESLIVESLIAHGYDPVEAARFANDGCWEIQIPGKTYFSYIPFDGLQILQKDTLNSYDGNASFADFEELYEKFKSDLRCALLSIGRGIADRFTDTEKPVAEWKWKSSTPCTVVSLFEKGCIEKGLSYLEGGPVYNVLSPHIGGLPDVVNSLYAIKKLVFDEKRLSFSDFMTVLSNNWEGNEALRQYALNKYSYFGNDNDEADLIGVRIIDDLADICREISKMSPYDTPAGVSTFGRQLEWAPRRSATPYGKKAGEVLSANFSPVPGTDREGATAIIRSYCKSDLRKTVSGAALDLKLLPSAVKGENGDCVISALIRGFVSLGGHFMQIDIADAALLKRAQENPAEYSSLSVRVSGWNARFVTLNREWQDMIIAQTGSDIQ